MLLIDFVLTLVISCIQKWDKGRQAAKSSNSTRPKCATITTLFSQIKHSNLCVYPAHLVRASMPSCAELTTISPSIFLPRFSAQIHQNYCCTWRRHIRIPGSFNPHTTALFVPIYIRHVLITSHAQSTKALRCTTSIPLETTAATHFCVDFIVTLFPLELRQIIRHRLQK